MSTSAILSATDTYLRSIRQLCPEVTDDDFAQFASRFTIRELKKKELFLVSGSVQQHLGFIAAGLVRSFYIDPEGNERTIGFYPEGEYATHYPAFITRRPSSYTIQCIEPTVFVCFTYEDQQWIYRRSPNFERYGRLVAEEVIKLQQARIESFVVQTAEERYLAFVKRRPTLVNRVSLSHLCSFLGIERQSLTRIRQRIARS